MKRYVAEALGTFILVFAGTGAIIVSGTLDGSIPHVGIALTFGLAVTTVIFAIGDISGAHINPAVTISFLAARRFPAADLLPYLAAQLVGAFAASGLLRALFPGHANLGTCLPAEGMAWQAFAFEVVMTFFLVFVILNVTTGAKEKGITAALAIGGTIALDALFGGPVSGASMNPARSLAPAVVSGELEFLWIYLAAPVIGGLLAAAIAGYLRSPDEAAGT